MKRTKPPFEWGRLDGTSFQSFCVDLLVKEGFRVEDQGIGPDGGKDIIATQKVAFQAGYERSYKWAVQAKYRRTATTAVSPHDLGNIGNLLSRFEADGFLLITNGRTAYEQVLPGDSLHLAG